MTSGDRADGGSTAGGTLSTISNEMVRLYKEMFGRGPTRARTDWVGQDALITILEDTLSPAERNLVRMGEHERLRESRMFFQYATVLEFCAPVEACTGRKVRAFLSGIDTFGEDVSAELFLLHPVGYDGPSRTEVGEGSRG
ncbi:MAG TPA: Na-translocating system protein MpsC family protein [Miltoncostaeaceae bacterium]|nr:Na-translocating system protein MpsC family protein [Miltoncostaeaceae bacterium]